MNGVARGRVDRRGGPEILRTWEPAESQASLPNCRNVEAWRGSLRCVSAATGCDMGCASSPTRGASPAVPLRGCGGCCGNREGLPVWRRPRRTVTAFTAFSGFQRSRRRNCPAGAAPRHTARAAAGSPRRCSRLARRRVVKVAKVEGEPANLKTCEHENLGTCSPEPFQSFRISEFQVSRFPPPLPQPRVRLLRSVGIESICDFRRERGLESSCGRDHGPRRIQGGRVRLCFG